MYRLTVIGGNFFDGNFFDDPFLFQNWNLGQMSFVDDAMKQRVKQRIYVGLSIPIFFKYLSFCFIIYLYIGVLIVKYIIKSFKNNKKRIKNKINIKHE